MADTNPTANNNANEPVNNQETPNTNAQAQQNNSNYDELFAKLDGALEKRFDGLAKSMLKGNGVADEDLTGIADAYRQYRTGKVEQNTQALTQAQQENASLKAQVLQMQIASIATTQAATLGIAPESVEYVTKLADLSKAVNEKGEPDETKIAEAMKEVLEKVPAFKKSAAENTGFMKVGGNGGTQETVNEQDARLRKAFGLK